MRPLLALLILMAACTQGPDLEHVRPDDYRYYSIATAQPIAATPVIR